MMLFNEVGQPQTTYTPGPATMGEGSPHPSPLSLEPHQFNVPLHQQQQAPRIRRKRKADHQDAHNERLSKRMSLLNLEQNGQKLYVPVEQPQIQSSPFAPQTIITPPTTVGDNVALSGVLPEEPMQLDDTKHKVYIYNLDDELSETEFDPDDPQREGKLIFLPDIEKHLRANRLPVPKPILPNKDGELAGMQLVLYSDGPSSISVPEEQDSVRKAIIEARARLREKQSAERRGEVIASSSTNNNADSHQSTSSIPVAAPAATTTATTPAATFRTTTNAKPTKISFATPVKFSAAQQMLQEQEDEGGPSGAGMGSDAEMITDDDVDAMDID